MTGKTASQHFKQIRQQLGVATDAPLEVFLAKVEEKLAEDPQNPELTFLKAELLRQSGEEEAAKKTYQQTVDLADQRTEQRAAALSQRVINQRRQLQTRLLQSILPALFLIVLAGIFTWQALNKTEPMPADANPEQFAFTEWLAKQQMVQIISTLQEQNPELSFDFNRSGAKPQSPMEFMQSLMQPDAFNRLRKPKSSADGTPGEGHPVFQCSKETPIQCSPADVPSAPGEKREEVVLLMNAYRSVMASEKDCDKIEQSINQIGEQLSWRKSEHRIKSDLEDFATECFYRAENVEKTVEHARKLQCTGDPYYINSVYWYLTAVTHKSGDTARARQYYDCFREATDYIEKNQFRSTYVAARHRESGALAWLYFDDLDTATSELEKARAIIKKEKNVTSALLQVSSEIDLDLMETYVTANIDATTFDRLHEDINSSGLLTDGYKQIKDTLAGIYYMQNGRNKDAITSLQNVSSRFRLMPEFICGWDWSGFRRGLKTSIQDDAIRQRAEALVDATNCYLPAGIAQRTAAVDDVIRWLRRN